MQLTAANYFSAEASLAYMSASQFKTFLDCEARALAELRGEYQRESTTALLIGSYVDAHFSGESEQFLADHPEVFTGKGALRADYVRADQIIQRIERDELFMQHLSGEPQRIFTGEIEGVLCKCKTDFTFPDKTVDLKVVRDFKPVYKEGQGRLSFIEAWGYDLQAAIYQRLVGGLLPFIIAAATKEKEPDIALIEIPQYAMDLAMQRVQENIARFDAIKRGEIEPIRCGHCAYCKRTKKLTRVLTMDEMFDDFGESEDYEQ